MTFAPLTLPPSGWYPDPSRASQLRWWNGFGWTEYTYPVVQPAPVPAPQPRVRAPRKWLGRWGGWILAAGSAGIWLWLIGFSFLLSALAPDSGDGPASLSPYLLITGGATVAAAILYTMCYKLRPEDGMTPSRLLIIAVVGGTAATLVAAPINSIVDVVSGGTDLQPSPVTLVLAGVVEELAKVSAAVVFALRLPVKNARIGLFVGGAIGLGFSVVENLDYLQQAFAIGQEDGSGFGMFLTTMIGRMITGPFLHPVFSALLAAAVFGAARAGRFRLTGRVVLAYLGVAAAHGLFNGMQWIASSGLLRPVAAGLLLLLFDLLFLVGSGVTWLLIVRRIRRADRAAAHSGGPDQGGTYSGGPQGGGFAGSF